jgi:uncharacterized protein YfaS (alpha-2-macroglobulin family)
MERPRSMLTHRMDRSRTVRRARDNSVRKDASRSQSLRRLADDMGERMESARNGDLFGQPKNQRPAHPHSPGNQDRRRNPVLDWDQPTAIRTFSLRPDLKLQLSSDTNAFVRLKVSAKPKMVPIQPIAINGLLIDRIYEKIHSDGKSKFLSEPKVGDLIRVTLPKDGSRYLAIVDPLPSIFETVNNDFKSQITAAGIHTSENDWQVTHSELSTDRAEFFLDHVWRKDTYTVTCLARCTIAGTATAPPAKVEAMYDPDNYALSLSRVLNSH